MLRLVMFIVAGLAAFLSMDVWASPKDPDLFIECVLDSRTVYERQPVSAVVTLFSTDPDVEFANPISDVRLARGEFSTLQPVRPAGSSYRRDIGGRQYYCFPLRTFVFTIDKKGSYELSGGEYEVGVSYPVIVNDPFWGRVRTAETREYKIPVKKTPLNVKTMPEPPADMDFSGSVGDFSIETVIPRGDIYLNEEATAIIVLRGQGMIAELTMPEYRDAFKNGMKLKSVSESRSQAYDKGRIISELQLECTFIPTSVTDAEIGKVYFDYFDPVSGAYRRAESEPVKVKVKSTVSKRESMDV